NAVLLALEAGLGAHQAENPVGHVRERGPRLLAGDDIVLAVAHGASAKRREIRARAWLRIALAPEILAVVDARQESLLLRVGAELQQHRRAHHQTERNQRGRARITARLLEDVTLDDVPAGAAPFLWPGRSDPALGGEDLVPAQQII